MDFVHKSVLLREAVNGLAVKPDGIYVDGTAGGGGHSAEILKHLGPQGKLICIDQDPEAVEYLRKRFINDSRVEIMKSNFVNIGQVLESIGITKVSGVLLDLGVSSHQLDTSKRGFSYHMDAVLDMRMSKEGVSAYDLVNTLSKDELSKILFEYAEEKYSKLIATEIVKTREVAPIETTLQLVDVIKKALPGKVLRKDLHPARKTFQALRIAVNDELNKLSEALEIILKSLEVGGRLSVITFHSLEDRIVKKQMKDWSVVCTCPPDFPICVCGRSARVRLITRKPILPSDEEIQNNKRSRSAKLRVCERI